ncbi:betaine--homocysteine S-methyltransferase 1-like [Branchiostoma floridae]|uniref:Betaine--homocysteine S-methyltransferase 1-like n=1 Tax=Branchiostoma floridae TaxID=7739 RepID=A0A9J7MXS0_BRAFL|nr:betaine--homocysteine S-methyltransferase 1-like [Branchiostoma floridae]
MHYNILVGLLARETVICAGGYLLELGLLARLQAGETVICAGGYLLELERRGYLQAGTFVPEVVVEHPDKVEALHREFVHAGSDVVLALTHYAHREKMRIIGREADLERMNRTALRLARKVADDTGTLMAGNICKLNLFDPNNSGWKEKAEVMFKEQLEWAVEGGADFVVAESFFAFAEAMFALQCAKKYAKGLPVVVTLNLQRHSELIDGVPIQTALKELAEAGADVVGLNCGRGPPTMLPVLEEAKNNIKIPLAAVPVPYRTHEGDPNFLTLKDENGKVAFPLDLDPWLCSRSQIAAFSRRARALGVRYLGLCCGNASHFTRAMAEALGRQPPASRYTADMSKHAYYGTDPTLIDFNTQEVCKNKF